MGNHFWLVPFSMQKYTRWSVIEAILTARFHKSLIVCVVSAIYHGHFIYFPRRKFDLHPYYFATNIDACNYSVVLDIFMSLLLWHNLFLISILFISFYAGGGGGGGGDISRHCSILHYKKTYIFIGKALCRAWTKEAISKRIFYWFYWST